MLLSLSSVITYLNKQAFSVTVRAKMCVIIFIRVFRKQNSNSGLLDEATQTSVNPFKQRMKRAVAIFTGRPSAHADDIYNICSAPPPYQNRVIPEEPNSQPRGLQNDDKEILNTIGMLLDDNGHIAEAEVSH